jgi:pterin-4a-carbinolamine dehydratase
MEAGRIDRQSTTTGKKKAEVSNTERWKVFDIQRVMRRTSRQKEFQQECESNTEIQETSENKALLFLFFC